MIYLDNNATTPLRPEVADVLDRTARGVFGNPSSLHAAGREAHRVLDEARETVARALGAKPAEIVFCASGSEADNLALLGSAAAAGPKRHAVATDVEHPAVERVLERLGREGWSITRVPVDGRGIAAAPAVADAFRPDTAFVSVMLANNETGMIQPVAEIARAARARGIRVHTDAVQALGKIPVRVDDLGVDLLSLSAHKFHGPKGVGILYVRAGTALEPLILGGGQERGLRSGTESVPLAAACAEAVRLAVDGLSDHAPRVARLRDRLWAALESALPGARRHGEPGLCLPNTISAAFPGVEAEPLVIALDLAGVGISAGSACHSGATTVSHSLAAMGLPPEVARATVRISLSALNRESEIDEAAGRIVATVRRLEKGRRPGETPRAARTPAAG